MIYDVKKDSFTSFEAKNDRFTAVEVYKDTLYIICYRMLYIMDVENHEENKKEIELEYFTQGIAINHNNVFISDQNGLIHVYDHEFQEVNLIEFKEGNQSIWLSLVNNFLISGSTWGTYKHVMIYDIIKNEKIIIPNPNNYQFWCVKPFEDLNQIFLGHKSGIMVYNFHMSKKRYVFTGKITSFTNIHFNFH